MLLQQLHTCDGHASVHRFAHVVDGEQGNWNSGKGVIQINNLQHTKFKRLARSCVFGWTKFGQDFLPTFSVRHTMNLSRPRSMPILGQFFLDADPTVPHPPNSEMGPAQTVWTMIRSNEWNLQNWHIYVHCQIMEELPRLLLDEMLTAAAE